MQVAVVKYNLKGLARPGNGGFGPDVWPRAGLGLCPLHFDLKLGRGRGRALSWFWFAA